MRNLILLFLTVILGILVSQSAFSINFDIKENGTLVGQYDSDNQTWSCFSYPNKPELIKLATPVVIDRVLNDLGDLDVLANKEEKPPSTRIIRGYTSYIDDSRSVYSNGSVEIVGNNRTLSGQTFLTVNIHIKDTDDYIFSLHGRYVNNLNQTESSISCW